MTAAVPLPKASTRGDQLLNANYFVKKGYAESLDQNAATPESLVTAVRAVYAERERYALRAYRQGRFFGLVSAAEPSAPAAVPFRNDLREMSFTSSHPLYCFFSFRS